MIYIYTQENCCECESKKKQFKGNSVRYIEREAARLKAPQDDIDREALVIASMQNMRLPVLVEGTVVDENECVS